MSKEMSPTPEMVEIAADSGVYDVITIDYDMSLLHDKSPPRTTTERQKHNASTNKPHGSPDATARYHRRRARNPRRRSRLRPVGKVPRERRR